MPSRRASKPLGAGERIEWMVAWEILGRQCSAQPPRMSEVYACLGCSSAAATLTPSSGSWMRGPAPFMRTQACTNAITVALLAAGKAQIVGAKSAPCFGRRQLNAQKFLVDAGLDFDSVDRRFAKMAAAAFVALIAVAVWMFSLGNGGRPLAPQAGRGIQHVLVTGDLRSAPSRPPCASADGGRWRRLSAYCS